MVFFMLGYWTLVALVMLVFAVITAGAGARRIGWLPPEAEESLLKLVVNLLYPCLIFSNVLGNAALRTPGNLLAGPVMGFVAMAGGIGLAYGVARWAGFSVGSGLRTFAFSVGIFNYGYMAIPLVEPLFGRETLGVLLSSTSGAKRRSGRWGFWCWRGCRCATDGGGFSTRQFSRWCWR